MECATQAPFRDECYLPTPPKRVIDKLFSSEKRLQLGIDPRAASATRALLRLTLCH
jgi:hypothetical protein